MTEQHLSYHSLVEVAALVSVCLKYVPSVVLDDRGVEPVVSSHPVLVHIPTVSAHCPHLTITADDTFACQKQQLIIATNDILLRPAM